MFSCAFKRYTLGVSRRKEKAPFFDGGKAPANASVVEMLSKETVLLTDIRVASSFLDRLKGLQLKEAAKAESLLLYPCQAIHTCFMRFPIDVAFFDIRGVLSALFQGVSPWKLWVSAPGSFLCLETVAGRMPENLRRGEMLSFRQKEVS